MQRMAFVCIVLMVSTVGFGQVVVSSGGIAVPSPVPLPPIFSGFSNSVIDSAGNILIFDNSFAVPIVVSMPTFAQKTHLTVISSDGKTVKGYDYDGSFQVLGIGRSAVYAIVNTFGTTSITQPVTVTRKLVAFRVSQGALSLPQASLDVPYSDDVKMSAGTGDKGLDTIAFISGAQLPNPLSASPVASFLHSVLLYASDGTSFTPNPNNPITTK